MFRGICRGRERGQMIVVFALIIPLLMGMTGMAIDVGGYASHRRDLQNAADSIALAAALDLPDSTQAYGAAQTWAAKNNVDWSDVTISVSPPTASQPNPQVSIDIKQEHAFSFMRVLGLDRANVSAHAGAIKTSPGGSPNLTPWAVLAGVQQYARPGDLVTLKYDAHNPTTGNFGALQIDDDAGSGSNVYEITIVNRSKSIVCAEGVETCETTSNVCPDDYICPSEPGNKVGGTRDGVDYLMSHTAAECDEFTEVFSGPNADGRYDLNNQCNPWVEGGYESNRVVMVPLVKSLCNGQCSLTIVGFGLFWLEGYQSARCQGNACEIRGRFVQADANVDALAGVYDPDSPIHFVRLSE